MLVDTGGMRAEPLLFLLLPIQKRQSRIREGRSQIQEGHCGRAFSILFGVVLILVGCSSPTDATVGGATEPVSEASETTAPREPDAGSAESDGGSETESVSSQSAELETVESESEPVQSAEAQTTTVSTGNSELDLVIDELSAYVEEERGLTFTNRPQVELLDDDEFGEAWLDLVSQDAMEQATSYQDFTDIYRAMGIISNDATLEEIWIRFGEAGVLGYYETDSEAIVLRNGEIDALTRTTLVHELVHALEDQNFDLDREAYDDRNDEINWAFSALAEGSARVIENRYRASLSDDELAEERDAIAALPRSVSFSEFNQSFLELQFGRYNYGEVFADALWAEGQPALDEAFEEPPTASELILDPSSFIEGVAPDAPVDPPPADGNVFEEGVWGEAAWIALLSDTFATSTALDLADGWGGDWFVAWRNGDDTCVRVDVAADSADELSEYESALLQWADAGSGRELTSPEPDLLRLTSCG